MKNKKQTLADDIVGPLIILILGFFLLIISILLFNYQKKIDTYITVTGRILNLEKSHVIRDSNQGTTVYYQFNIRYFYTVGNNDYQSSYIIKKSINIDPLKYNEGSEITVYYDPANPSKSIIDKKSWYFAIITLTGFALIFTIPGIVGGVLTLRKKKVWFMFF